MGLLVLLWIGQRLECPLLHKKYLKHAYPFVMLVIYIRSQFAQNVDALFS